MTDYKVIQFIKKYVIEAHRGDTEYVRLYKAELNATIIEVTKKILEYTEIVNKKKKELYNYCNNTGEVLAQIKNDILYNSKNANDVQLKYEIYQAIDNSNSTLYKDIIEVYKRQKKELEETLNVNKNYEMQFSIIRNKLYKMLSSIYQK